MRALPLNMHTAMMNDASDASQLASTHIKLGRRKRMPRADKARLTKHCNSPSPPFFKLTAPNNSAGPPKAIRNWLQKKKNDASGTVSRYTNADGKKSYKNDHAHHDEKKI